MPKARILSSIFRFMDNLCTFDNDKFENNYSNIYNDEQELKKENEDPCKAWCLDIS